MSRYLAAAFNARPLGMPIPPNWMVLAAFGLLGGLLNPGFLLMGAGLELAYLWTLSSNPRFRTAVDAAHATPSAQRWDERQRVLAEQLPLTDRRVQEQIEERCREIAAHLKQLGADRGDQAARLAQLCWLHLRLLAARGALAQVVRSGAEAAEELTQRSAELERRLADDALEYQLRGSLEDQQRVIGERQQAHAQAAARLEFVDAELERIRQQVALTHEQALLATDAGSIALSVDALAASLGEANRWLHEQREILGGLDDLDTPPAELLLKPKRSRVRSRKEKGELQ